MQRWEYARIQFRTTGGGWANTLSSSDPPTYHEVEGHWESSTSDETWPDALDGLAALGQEGWELVSGKGPYILKRPL